MLKLENVDVFLGKTQVLHQLSMSVKHGEIIALIGANGVGKTTVLRTVSGLVRPVTGRLLYSPDNGSKPLDLTSVLPEQIVKVGISQCPEGRGIFSQLSVKENLLIGAYLREDDNIGKDLEFIYQTFPVLKERSKLAGGVLSGGEQMMLALGRSLMSRPKLLILDEPSLGLAPIMIETLFNMIRNIRRLGVTILLVEQNATMALELADRAYVLENGRVALSGKSENLARNSLVRKAYLGGVKWIRGISYNN